MSLISRIFFAFSLMIAITVVTGIIGWSTMESINATSNQIINYEMAAENDLNLLETSLQAITVAQRTLLINTLSQEDRAAQHIEVQSEQAAQLRLIDTLDTLLNSGSGTVAGWQNILVQWRSIQPILKEWNVAITENEDKIRIWEATTILDPASLLRDLMQYRGDHFQLATRLGEMIAKEENIGPDISAADNLCAFGRWRVRFDNGEELFSGNQKIREAMDIMTAPHREFHQSAADVQQLLKNGYKRNQQAITQRYLEHLAAAEKVIGTFQMIINEAENARQLFEKAQNGTMVELRSKRLAALDALAKLVEANRKNMKQNLADAEKSGAKGVQRTQILSLVSLLAGVLTLAYLYFTMRRQLIGPLTRVIAALGADAKEVALEADGVAGSSASLSEGSTSQAASLEQTSAAIEQITSMTRKNLDNSKLANENMHASADQIRKSTEAVNRMSVAMGEIKDASEKIGNILKTIEEIAFQTNLLALNAAVEAARAGEAGKGFAVVADEVRNLAQRSAQAVKDTAELITGTVERVGNGVQITGEIETLFKKIADNAGAITRMVEEIEVATGEQTLGMEQINHSVARIDGINQDNARYAETNAQASVNLNQRASDLLTQVEQLGVVLRNIIGSRAGGGRNHNSAGNNQPHRSQKALPPPTAGKQLPPPKA